MYVQADIVPHQFQYKVLKDINFPLLILATDKESATLYLCKCIMTSHCKQIIAMVIKHV